MNGFCIAGGLEFLQGTDIRIAAEHATFGLGEARWGIIATGGSHLRLPRQIPWAVAMELLLGEADRREARLRHRPREPGGAGGGPDAGGAQVGGDDL